VSTLPDDGWAQPPGAPSHPQSKKLSREIPLWPSGFEKDPFLALICAKNSGVDAGRFLSIGI
jgi:hypothetical protein